MMNVFSFLSLSEDVNFWIRISLTVNLWQFSLNIECETTKFLNIDWSSSSDVVADVLNQSFPNDQELCLWLEWFQIWWGSLSRLIMFTWVFVSVGKDPIDNLFDMHFFLLNFFNFIYIKNAFILILFYFILFFHKIKFSEKYINFIEVS